MLYKYIRCLVLKTMIVQHNMKQIYTIVLAVAASAAGNGGVDLAGVANALRTQQSLLHGAREAVGSGQGAQLLASINAQVVATGERGSHPISTAES